MVFCLSLLFFDESSVFVLNVELKGLFCSHCVVLSTVTVDCCLDETSCDVWKIISFSRRYSADECVIISCSLNDVLQLINQFID